MLKTSPTSIILQSLIDAAGNNEVNKGENGGNETNLSNSFASKKSIEAGYLISKRTKKDGGNPNSGSNNTKKSVKAAKSSDYLTPDAKKAFNS